MKKNFQTDILTLLPLAIPVGLIIVMRPVLSPCTKENNCQGSLIIVASLLGAILAISLYLFSKKNKDLGFSSSQEKRLLWGSLGWAGLFLLVAIEMLVRNIF